MTTPEDPRFVMHPVSLAFADVSVERAWRADLSDELIGYVRFGVLAFAVLFSGFVASDLSVFRAHLLPLLAIRFGVVVPALLLASWWTGTSHGRRVLTRWMQEFLLALTTLVCGSMLAMSSLVAPDAGAEQVWFAALGFQLTLLGVYGLSRLRFLYAVAVGLLTSASLVVLLRRAPGAPPLVVLTPFILAVNLAGMWVTRTLEVLGRRAFARRQELAEARARSELLLRNVLPDGVADRLRGAGANRAAIAERYDSVTVVLADVVGFTGLCEQLAPEQIAALLDRLYARFDELCADHGVEKIKTLGDGWLAAAGVPVPRADHAEIAARLALAMRDVPEVGGPSLRIGVYTGPAVAGVIGRTRFAYDLWGDAVAGAMAMERDSRPGGIRLGEGTVARLSTRFVIDSERWLLGERSRPGVAPPPEGG